MIEWPRPHPDREQRLGTLAHHFRRFAEYEARGYSPLYEVPKTLRSSK